MYADVQVRTNWVDEDPQVKSIMAKSMIVKSMIVKSMIAKSIKCIKQ